MSKIIIKSIINRGIAIAFSLILLPLWLVVIICLKVSEPNASVFYNHIRYGKHKKPFVMYKFRTMRTGVPPKRNQTNPFLHIDQDNRVTKLGKILRKYSIDETLQLINIIKGDMIFIGPRPCIEADISFLPPERFTVMPGFTGTVRRWREKQPDLQSIYRQEQTFITNYGWKIKMRVLIDGIKLLWHNK